MVKREAGRLLCDFLSGKDIPEARLEKLSPADWESLADWALRFKVGALLYREIKSRNLLFESIPGEVSNRLRQAYRDLASRNTSLFGAAVKVFTSLADHHLPVIALKGLALAKSIYGDIALRPMTDMDLLVKEEDLVKAGRLLLTLGYQQSFPAWESMAKTYHHLPPFKKKTGELIELHWNIVTPDSPVKVDIAGLWARACLIKVDGAEIRVFSAEDLFLHVCVHACFHLQTGLSLIPLCDMARLIKTSADKIDWQTVMARASRWSCQKCVYLMLLLVRELLGVAPPEKILSEFRPADYQPAFLAEALDRIFNERPSGQQVSRRIGQLAKIKKAKGLKSKIQVILKGAFPSKAYLARIYPVSVSSPKIYLCYLSRLGGLTVYYAKVLFRLFRREQSVLKTVDQEQRGNAVFDWMFS